MMQRYMFAAPSKAFLGVALAALIFLVMTFALVNVENAAAATGTRYTASLERSYKHPVTGKIEDSGGAASYATGQAMVESAVSKTGLLEVASNGSMYLTMRMSLIDHIKSFDFKVQKRGASGWSSVKGEVTKRGSDKSGITNDVRVKVPSKSSVVRVKMFVTSMGRDVIYYVSVGAVSKGTPAGFKSLIVTSEASGSASNTSSSSKSSNSKAQKTSSSKGEKNSDKDASKKNSSEKSEKAAEGSSQESGNDSSAEDLNNESTSSAQGLSLSTTPDTAQAKDSGQAADSSSQQPSAAEPVDMVQLVLIASLAFLVAGLLLVAVIAVVVWQFRLRWNRWSSKDPDDYSVEYRRQHHGE